jgi:glucose/arabinose dehydrogenase
MRPDLTKAKIIIGILLVVTSLTLIISPASAATTLPDGFVESLVASGFDSPTNMVFAPDGRLFVLDQPGKIWVIKNGTLLATPFLSITVNNIGERGMLGLAFDPSFASNQYVYVYYTAPTPNPHNRLSRFTANGDVVAAGSELPLIDFPDLFSTAYFHNGGVMEFGPDGKLYVGVGDNWNSPSPQIPDDFRGKIFRLNTDGSAPSDNPYYATNTGINKGVWAIGFRNPFVITFQPGTGKLYANDVGTDYYEEINEVVKQGNYGYALYEGYSNAPGYISPLYAYSHSASGLNGGCAITGGAFYNPSNPGPTAFPAQYTGKYFFADFCRSYFKVFDPATKTVTPFASDTYPSLVSLRVASDGKLYYLARGSNVGEGAVFRVEYEVNSPPQITQNPSSTTVLVGQTASFSCAASGKQPITYQWQKNDTNIPGAVGATYITPATTPNDNNATFRCVATNAYGSATSARATLRVNSGNRPVATIVSPLNHAVYYLGDTINFYGVGADSEDGNLPASAYTWWIDLYHQPPNLNLHIHPALPETSGITFGSLTIPVQPHGDGKFWYRIHLRVTDSVGNTDEKYVDINLIQTTGSPTPVPTPGFNAAPQRNYFTTRTPTLTWSRITYAVRYELQVSLNAAFTLPIAVPKPLSDQSPSYTFAAPLPDGVYYWRVRALDINGRPGAWSQVESFVIAGP